MTEMGLDCFDFGRRVLAGLSAGIEHLAEQNGSSAHCRKRGGRWLIEVGDGSRTDEKGPKPLSLVFVRKHESEDRRGRIAGSDVQFHCVFLPGDDDVEANLLSFARVLRISDGELRHRRDVMADTGYILTGLFQCLFDDRPHRRRASEGMFPVLADGVGLAQVYEDTVLDGLGAGVGVDGLTERIFTGHGFVPFGPWGVCHDS